MRNPLLTIAALLIVSISLLATAQSDEAGSRPFSFLNLDFGAKTIAMGGASIAVDNGIFAAFANPAALGYMTKTQVGVGFRSVIDDVVGGPVGYAMPSKFGVFGFNLLMLSYGTTQEVLESSDGRPLYTGNSVGGYSSSGQISWANTVWENLSLGVSIRGIFERLVDLSLSAACLQAGMQYRSDDSRLIVGLAFSNAGFMASQNGNDLKLPIALAAGISYILPYVPALRLALDLKQSADLPLMYKPGIEIAVYKKYLFLRAGYPFSQTDAEEVVKLIQGEPSDNYQKSTFNGPAFGVGLMTDINKGKDINADVAVQFNDLEPAFALSIMLAY